MTVYRYRLKFPTFPRVPTFKSGVRNWVKVSKVPKPGPAPGETRSLVVYYRGQGMTFRQIGKELGIRFQTAHVHWRAHLKRENGEQNP